MVAVDIPSGVMGDSGESLGAACGVLHGDVRAQETGAFACCRAGTCAADIVVAEIGIPPAVLSSVVDRYLGKRRPHCGGRTCRELSASGNKYSRGHALLCGGYPDDGCRAPGGARRGAQSEPA